MKLCPKCKTEKDSVDFYADSKCRDGLSGWCKCCVREARRARYLRDGRKNRTTDIRMPFKVVCKERRRQRLVVQYGIDVVEAMEAIPGDNTDDLIFVGKERNDY